VRANLHASEARADAAQANYQQTVLLAIEDIDNALVTGFNQQRVRVRSPDRTEHAEQTRGGAGAHALPRRRDRFLELLDAERTQLSAEDDLAAGRSVDQHARRRVVQGTRWRLAGLRRRALQRWSARHEHRAVRRAQKSQRAVARSSRPAAGAADGAGQRRQSRPGFEMVRQLSATGMTVLLGSRELAPAKAAQAGCVLMVRT
jgi:hypothetical protein